MKKTLIVLLLLTLFCGCLLLTACENGFLTPQNGISTDGNGGNNSQSADLGDGGNGSSSSDLGDGGNGSSSSDLGDGGSSSGNGSTSDPDNGSSNGNNNTPPVNVKQELEYTLESDGTYTVTGIGTYVDAELEIPDVYEGKAVKKIKEYAFKGATNLTTLVVPDGITALGEGFLSGCSSLEEITVPFIGVYAASDENSLYRYPLGKIFGTDYYEGSERTQQAYYYDSATNLTTDYFYIPSTLRKVTVLGGYVSSLSLSNLKVTSIVLGEGIQDIGAFPLMGCSKLEELTIPFVGAHSDMSEYANYGPFGMLFGTSSGSNQWYTEVHQWLTSTTDDSPVQDHTYDVPKSLRSVTVLGGVIPKYAFAECSMLTSLTFGKNVSRIAYYALPDCTSLRSITLSSGITKIGGTTTRSLSSLGEWRLGSLGSRNYALSSITFDAENPYFKAVDNCLIETSTKTLLYGCKDSKIPTDGSVEIIGAEAFSGCSGLTSISIPASVTTIHGAFINCSNLNTVTFEENSNLTMLGERAFGASGLKNIELPAGLRSIEASAFQSCTELTKLTIPDSVTSIRDNALYDCTSLTELTIPFVGNRAGVKATDTYQYPFGVIFGLDAREGNTAAEQHFIGSNTSSWMSRTFYIPSSLRTVTVTGGHIPYGAFYGCSMLTTIKIPDSTKVIGNAAFYGCTNLTSFEFPSALTDLGKATFRECYNLSIDVVIPQGVTTLGEQVFYGTPINSITLPYGLTSIGTVALGFCPGLKEVVIPDTVRSFGNGVFYYCMGLESVTLPSNYSFTELPLSTFESCTNLKRVSIPSSIRTIGSNAFASCRALTSINYAGTESMWRAISKGSGWNTGMSSYYVICSDTTLGY